MAWPFDVVAGGTTVRAVGTQFDVDRHPGVTTVAVVEGKVLISGTGENRLRLAAGEQVTLGAHATRQPVAADTTTAVANNFQATGLFRNNGTAPLRSTTEVWGSSLNVT